MKHIYHLITKTLRYIGLLFFMLLTFTLSAQKEKIDTTNVYAIDEVVITDQHYIRETRSMSPTQTFNRNDLKRMQTLQLSDAVKHFAGVTVKDYGGIGGLKTISLRSLGAEHTAVGYDGVAITNSQTGQIDIGRFSLENVDRISLSNGQTDQIFQPARFFASAGILNIQTLSPEFKEKKNINLKAMIKGGSWGLINPALWLDKRLSDKWAVSVNGEAMWAKGDYPYKLYYGDNNDLTSNERRSNTRVESFRVESGLFGKFSDNDEWRTKVYYYQSSRGLPNATTYYYDFASQHLWDKNLFVQSKYKKEFSTKWLFESSAKYSYNYQRYLDPDYKNSFGLQDNKYHQHEYYLSAVALYRVLPNLSFSAAIDGSIQTLNTNSSNIAKPQRYSCISAFAGKYVNEWLTAAASGVMTVVNDHNDGQKSGAGYRKITPYASLSIQPFAAEDFRLRLFYKEIFRLPTFNDLYYGQVGNRDLVPEKVKQYNAGITYAKALGQFINYISVTGDFYYNRVSDKIVAVPTKNLFIWSMVNLGKVEIKGMDITGNVVLQLHQKVKLNLSGNYTYQRALDTTDPNGKTYKHQIAYTPRVTASGQGSIETPWINFSYSLLYSGSRYALAQNIKENRLPGYTDHSISLYRDFKTGKFIWTLNAEVLNLMNRNYEIVRNFPMPGRSFRATLKMSY